MSVKYVDFSGGNDANDCSSFANRGKTITGGFTAARIAPGDELRIMKSPAPSRVQDSTGTDLNATFTNKSQTVTLSAAATKTLYLDGAWTAATGDVTCTTSASRKEGSNSSSIAIATAFTTGLVAYFALSGGAQDLSAYTKITLFLRCSTVVAAGRFRIDLCSDAAGATPVNSFTINEVFTSNTWKCLTLDNGGALGSSIQSIALYCLIDPATVTVLIDDVLAANRLTLTSLIGKSSNEVSYEWYPIQSINGTTILLDYHPNQGIAATRGYYGTTETVAIYAREPIRISATQIPNEPGTAGNINLYKGGYDETNMTSQDGLTFLDPGDANINGLTIANALANYSSFDRLVFVRCAIGLQLGSASAKVIKFPNIGFVGCGTNSLSINNVATQGVSIGNMYIVANGTSGAGAQISVTGMILNNLTIWGCGQNGLLAAGSNKNGFIQNISVYNCTSNGINDSASSFININNAVCRDNAGYGIACGTAGLFNIRRYTSSGNGNDDARAAAGGVINISDSDCSGAITTDISWSRVNISNYQGTPGDYRVFGNATTLIAHETTVEHTSGKGSSKHSPSTDFDTDLPLIQKAGIVVVNSGSQTHSFWVRRSNSGGTARIVLRGGQIAGVDSDVTVTISVAIDTWEKLDLTFNPTEDGVPIEFELQSFGTGNLYFADYVAP